MDLEKRIKELTSENENLTKQVSSLIATECQLYDTQKILDDTIQIYKEFYAISKEIQLCEVPEKIIPKVSHFIISKINFEFCSIFEYNDSSEEVYHLVQEDGYFSKKIDIAQLSIDAILLESEIKDIRQSKGYTTTRDLSQKSQDFIKENLYIDDGIIFMLFPNNSTAKQIFIMGNSSQNQYNFRDPNQNAEFILSIISLAKHAFSVQTLLKANKTMETQEKKYKSLFNNSKDALLIIDYQGAIVNSNHACKELFPNIGQDSGSLVSALFGNQPISDLSLTDYKDREISIKTSNNQVITALVTVTMHDDGNQPFIQVSIHDISEIKKSKVILEEYNETLKSEVNKKTKMIQDTLDDLKRTQSILIENEKLASLGQLVAGVAHELNTPIGIAVTSSSFMTRKGKEFSKKFENNILKKSDFKSFVEDITDSCHIVLNNMQRASELIQSFKMVSSDTVTESKRCFNIHKYLSDLIISLSPELKHHTIKIYILSDDRLEFNSYPGIFAQIITNFITNSINHGFRDKQDGTILIRLYQKDQYNFILDYIDNGKGIPDNIIKKIYDPFFTTRGNSGGTGLGLNIVHNLIGTKLSGVVTCISRENKETRFTIKLPIEILHFNEDLT